MSIFRIDAIVNSMLAQLDNITIDVHNGPSKEQVREILKGMSSAIKQGISSKSFEVLSNIDRWSRGGSRLDPAEFYDDEDSASDAIALEGRPAVQWHTSAEQPSVDYKLEYKNEGPSPVKCIIQVAVREVPRAQGGEKFWQQVSMNTHHFILKAGQNTTLQGTLMWSADANHMPQIAFPDPSSGQELKFYRCRVK
jgi:hypothetical protein